MRAIPPRTMSDVWWGRNKKQKEKIIEVPKIIKERVLVMDEKALKDIFREYTKDTLDTLAEEMADRAFRTPIVEKEDRVRIGTAFIDPTTDEVQMEHNIERLGQVEKSQTDIQNAIESLKKIKRGVK